MLYISTRMNILDRLATLSSAQVSLSQADVHIWSANQDAPIYPMEQLWQTLSNDEQQRATRFHFERDRRRFIVGRGLLRAILGRYAHIEAAQVRFVYGQRGKPALAEVYGGETLKFNVSHSNGHILCAITNLREIGVDIEHVHVISEADAIAERFFSTQENEVYRQLPAEEKLTAFFNCWTRKEAYIKATGDGLSRPLDQFSVSFVPGEPARMVDCYDIPEEVHRWSFYALHPAPGYIAALCVEGQNCHLTSWP